MSKLIERDRVLEVLEEIEEYAKSEPLYVDDHYSFRRALEVVRDYIMITGDVPVIGELNDGIFTPEGDDSE